MEKTRQHRIWIYLCISYLSSAAHYSGRSHPNYGQSGSAFASLGAVGNGTEFPLEWLVRVFKLLSNYTVIIC